MNQERDTKRDRFRMLTAFGMIFLVFALFLGRETVWIPCRNAVSAWWWDAVPAKVISSRIESLPRTGRAAFRIDYRYECSGIRCGSIRYSFFPENLPDEAERLLPLLRQYPAGAQITCYVVPASPMEAVIDRSIPPHYFVRGVAVLAGMLLGIGLFIHAVRIRRRSANGADGFHSNNG